MVDRKRRSSRWFFIAGLVCAFALMFAFARISAANTGTGLRGDYNGDGKVGLLDVIERKGNTRYLNKQSSEDMMKRVVWLKQKGFPLSMINKVMRG